MNTFYFTTFLISATLSVISANIEVFPFGGVEVQPHSIPSIVSLVFKSGEKNVSFCTGSLLNENWILTASHCLELYPDIHVIAGHHSMDKLENTTQIRKAFALYQHKSMLGSDSDCVGLIYVEKGFTFNKEVQPVVLGNLSTVTDNKLVVQGWGASLSSKVRIYPENLRSANLSIISAEQCKAAYPMEFDDNYNFCAGGLNRGACVEQSGGPVLQNGIQVGIVPWRIEECDGIAALLIFRKVSPYNMWIKEQIFQSSTLDATHSVEEVELVESNENEDSLIKSNVNFE